MNIRTVLVRDRKSESAAWGTSSAGVKIRSIKLDWTGRNEPTTSSFYEDGYSYAVSRWTREDGKIDSYADVINEAELNGLN